MRTSASLRILMGLGLAAALVFPAASGRAQVGAADNLLLIAEEDIDDLKSVLTTVRSKDLIEARVRTPGTVVSLKVTAGSEVKAGELVARLSIPRSR